MYDTANHISVGSVGNRYGYPPTIQQIRFGVSNYSRQYYTSGIPCHPMRHIAIPSVIGVGNILDTTYTIRRIIFPSIIDMGNPVRSCTTYDIYSMLHLLSIRATPSNTADTIQRVEFPSVSLHIGNHWFLIRRTSFPSVLSTICLLYTSPSPRD